MQLSIPTQRGFLGTLQGSPCLLRHPKVSKSEQWWSICGGSHTLLSFNIILKHQVLTRPTLNSEKQITHTRMHAHRHTCAAHTFHSMETREWVKLGGKTLRNTRETHSKCRHLTIEKHYFLGYFNKSKNNREEMTVGRKNIYFLRWCLVRIHLGALLYFVIISLHLFLNQ